MVLPDRQRRDPDPAADEQRRAARARRAKADPERAEDPETVARAELAQPFRSRSDVLDQELELVTTGRRAQHAEGPGQERPLAVPPTPALGGGQHVELPGLRAGPVGVGGPQNGVGPMLLAPGDGHVATAERRPHAVDDRRAGAQCTSEVRAWISCSETTCGSWRRAAEIARAAAIPPAIVVMHGIPRAMAAERIS